MTEYQPIKEGKVREIYDIGDYLILVATDRISCFDVILHNTVNKKGTVLTQMSKFWFDLTSDIVPNHMISTDVQDMPEFFRQPRFDGNSMMVKKLTMLPVECIVRGYITGSGWASYQKDGTVCGIKLPEGLKESEKLPEGGDRRPRREHLLRAEHRLSGEALPGSRGRIRDEAQRPYAGDLQEVRGVCAGERHHHRGYEVRVRSGRRRRRRGR